MRSENGLWYVRNGLLGTRNQDKRTDNDVTNPFHAVEARGQRGLGRVLRALRRAKLLELNELHARLQAPAGDPQRRLPLH